MLGINFDVERGPLRRLDYREFAVTSRDFGSLRGLALRAARANERGDPREAAALVALASRSDDELIRVCALGSAIDFFDPRSIDIPDQIAWFLRNARQPETFELLSIIMARVSPVAALGAIPPGTANAQSLTAPGLMAIHGTVLPYSQSNRPEWSVPNKGSMFAHIQGVRPDIYASNDYFRWEGGYTDYAREVAMTNLFDWLNSRGLHGMDVVAHSHGCNVVMASTSLGATYNKIVLLSCPVHWSKYSLPSAMLTKNAISIRTKMDYVILADRGGQRFPVGTIKDEVLPIWFSHSATVEPKTWIDHNLDRFL